MDLARQASSDGVSKFVAGAVVHSNGCVLLVSRSGDDDFLPGMEELPSGSVEDGESIEEGRDRELHEEIGLEDHAVDDDFVGLFDYRDGRGRLTRQFTFSIPWPGGEPVLSIEHSSFRWIAYDELAACRATPETKDVLERWWAWRRQSTVERSWRNVGSTEIYKGRVTLASHRVELSDGELIDFEVDESIPFAVAVLVVEGSSVVLARQYRYPIDRWIYDLPGGAGDAGEAPAAAAARECREELGLDPTDLTPLHVFYPNPGRSAWPVHLFAARSTVAAVPDRSDPAEHVRTVRMRVTELDDRIARGEIVDPSLLIARLAGAARGLLPPVG